MKRMVKKQWDKWGSCFFNGGVLSKDHQAKDPEEVTRLDACGICDVDFIKDAEANGLVATDGAGGQVGARSKRHRSVGAGAAVVTLSNDLDITKVSVLKSKSRGSKQSRERKRGL